MGCLIDDPTKGCVWVASLRDAIRKARKLPLTYWNGDEIETTRIVRPVAVIYHLECFMIAASCQLRSGSRHFRMDRIWCCDTMEDSFPDQAMILHPLWSEQEGYPANYAGVRS